jgi:hypothetical protein
MGCNSSRWGRPAGIFFKWGEKESNFEGEKKNIDNIQGVIESCTDILTTSYWLHVELGKNLKKIKWHLFFGLQFFKLLLVFYVVLQPRR